GKIRLEPHHRHGRQRREKAGKHHLQEVLRKGGKLRVDLELDAGGEEGEALEQALDIRIGAFGYAFEREAPSDLGKLLGELGRALPHVQQLVVVVLEEPRIHQRRPGVVSSTWVWPDSRSSCVR